MKCYATDVATGANNEAKKLRVIVTNPFAWPYVRRGSERLLNDLAEYLSIQGHQVSVLAMAPNEHEAKRNEVNYHFLRYGFNSRFRQLNSCHFFAFFLQSVFKDIDADVVFCLNYFDAFAALQAKKKYDLTYKVIFQSVGIPTKKYFRAVPLDYWFMHTVLERADEIVTLSKFAHQRLRDEFDCESHILPPPVFTENFSQTAHQIDTNEDTFPAVLFVGDVCEQRKGAVLLIRAFAVIKQEFPLASLIFVGNVSSAIQDDLLSLPEIEDVRSDISFAGLGDVKELPALYQNATVTVLPAVWEAFGLVLVESLAAGTPVVGVRHGGITDIVTEGSVGYLFEAGEFSIVSENVSGLAEAVINTISMTSDSGLAARCKARAEQFNWDNLGPMYEQLILDVVAK